MQFMLLRPGARAVTALVAATGVALLACGEDPPAPRHPPAGQAHAAVDPAQPGAQPPAMSPTGASSPAARKAAVAAPLPGGATPGDIILAPPRPAPRLGRGPVAADGRPAAPLLPEISCEQLAPDASYRLAQRVAMYLPAAPDAEAPLAEVCLFHAQLERPDAERATRTGRRHAVVAAFPGREVATWVSPELEGDGPDAGGEAVPPASGWAAVLPTGVPTHPALVVVSARLYLGNYGQLVRTRRLARVLRAKSGRWSWEPLADAAEDSLDLDFVDQRCKADPAAAGCDELVAQATVWRADAEARLDRREQRLGGKPVSAGKHDGDPQSEWLRRGRAALAAGKHDDALAAALRVEMYCGEATLEARALYDAVTEARGERPWRLDPRPRQTALCLPMADRGGPPRKP